MKFEKINDDKIRITLELEQIFVYIKYVIKLNRQRIDYNISFEKGTYYLKYTFIKFLIYLSQLSIIIITPFVLNIIRI